VNIILINSKLSIEQGPNYKAYDFHIMWSIGVFATMMRPFAWSEFMGHILMGMSERYSETLGGNRKLQMYIVDRRLVSK
jgi:hypothetical protein